MTPAERASLYDSAAVPLVLWDPAALRHVASTRPPPPPVRPDWVGETEWPEMLRCELGGMYRMIEAESLAESEHEGRRG